MSLLRAVSLCAACVAGVASTLPASALEAPAPAIVMPRLGGPIVLDGELGDAGWADAAVVDTFYETVFGDNREPVVKTFAYFAYDERHLYVALRCDDPEPASIRAPYVDRDAVIGTDDNVAIFLDTRGDRRVAQEFRVNPRGIQGDAVYNDDTGSEDFSPDFYYDSAARVTESGWTAELRIPLSSLRYLPGGPQSWGVLVWRNYPRERRYAIYSSQRPRGANCWMCLARPLSGIEHPPAASQLVAAPYAAVQSLARATRAGQPLGDTATDASAGLDVKWSPSASMAVDATLKPDFSQVEADVAQIGVNNRFALFYPEKRPFFLEGVDLFQMPIRAVHTRTITSPRWGGRATGKLAGTSYTLLLAEDRGGGSVVVPGPTGSAFAPQDFRSLVAVGRLRREFGPSFAGLLLTDREIDGGGHNRVFGPDLQWRPSRWETLTGQFLWSDTLTRGRPRLESHALSLAWSHSGSRTDWSLRYRDVGEAFRADTGFVPQVGYRAATATFGRSHYPKGFFSFLRPLAYASFEWDRQGRVITRRLFPGGVGLGRRNFNAEVDLNFDQYRVRDRLLSVTNVSFFAQLDPSRRVTRIGIDGYLGEGVDYANARVGRGGEIGLTATLRPEDRLTLDASSRLSWLDVDAGRGSRERLFTAQVHRLKTIWSFSARAFLRVIVQYVGQRRQPSLYEAAVPARSGELSGSALFSYRLNWQTALHLGYGDDREHDDRERLARTGRQLFAKVSYSFRR